MNHERKDGLVWVSDVLEALMELRKATAAASVSSSGSNERTAITDTLNHHIDRIERKLFDLVPDGPLPLPVRESDSGGTMKVWQFAEWVASHPLKSEIEFETDKGGKLLQRKARTAPALVVLEFGHEPVARN